jgi:hypothetical protein
MRKLYEGAFVNPKDLRQVQDCSASRGRAGDLRESQAQTAAGVMISKFENRSLKVVRRCETIAAHANFKFRILAFVL